MGRPPGKHHRVGAAELFGSPAAVLQADRSPESARRREPGPNSRTPPTSALRLGGSAGHLRADTGIRCLPAFFRAALLCYSCGHDGYLPLVGGRGGDGHGPWIDAAQTAFSARSDQAVALRRRRLRHSVGARVRAVEYARRPLQLGARFGAALRARCRHGHRHHGDRRDPHARQNREVAGEISASRRVRPGRPRGRAIEISIRARSISPARFGRRACR